MIFSFIVNRCPGKGLSGLPDERQHPAILVKTRNFRLIYVFDSFSIGSMDVIDLLNSTIAMFSTEGRLPSVQGTMTCSKKSTAAVEWKLYGY